MIFYLPRSLPGAEGKLNNVFTDISHGNSPSSSQRHWWSPTIYLHLDVQKAPVTQYTSNYSSSPPNTCPPVSAAFSVASPSIQQPRLADKEFFCLCLVSQIQLLSQFNKLYLLNSFGIHLLLSSPTITVLILYLNSYQPYNEKNEYMTSFLRGQF